MRLTRLIAATSVCAFVALAAGCTSDVDLEAAREEASAYLGAGSAHDNAIGSTTSRLEPGASEPTWVQVSFGGPMSIDGFTIACFGDGAALAEVDTRMRSDWTQQLEQEIVCDGTPSDLQLAQALSDVDEVGLRGSVVYGDGAVLALTVLGE